MRQFLDGIMVVLCLLMVIMKFLCVVRMLQIKYQDEALGM